MPRSFLTSAISPNEQSENSSAFLAGMNIGATTQGRYEQNLADQKSAEVDASHKMQLQQLKEQGDTYRRMLENTAGITKLGIDTANKRLDDDEAKNHEVLVDNTGRYNQVQRDAAAKGLKDNQKDRQFLGKAIQSFDPSAVQPTQIPNAPSSYDPTSFATPTKEYTMGTQGKLASDVSKGKIDGMDAASQQKFMDTYGFPSVTKALEYKSGSPLAMMLQNNSQQFQASTADKPDKVQQREEDDLVNSAPGALSQFYNWSDSDAAWQKDLAKTPIVPRDKYSEPGTREKLYNLHSQQGVAINDKVNPLYQKNFAVQLRKNPYLKAVVEEVQSDKTKTSANWGDIGSAKVFAQILAKRIVDAGKAGDAEKAGQLHTAYENLGYTQALGSPESWFNQQTPTKQNDAKQEPTADPSTQAPPRTLLERGAPASDNSQWVMPQF